MSWRTCVFLSFFANFPCKKHLGVVWWLKKRGCHKREVLKFWGPSVQFWDASKVHSEKQTWQWNWNTWTLNECVGLPFVETDMKSFCQPVITSIFSQVTCEDRLYQSGSSCSVTCPTGYRTGHHHRILTLQESLCRQQSLRNQWLYLRFTHHTANVDSTKNRERVHSFFQFLFSTPIRHVHLIIVNIDLVIIFKKNNP